MLKARLSCGAWSLSDRQVGEELTEQGILAVIYALIGIFLYVMFRFQWRFSVGAVVAVVHDIMVTMGFLSLAQVEFDLTVVAALLAVVGYSFERHHRSIRPYPRKFPAFA